MGAPDDVTTGECRIDRRGLLGLPERDWVGGSRSVEPIDSAEVKENAGDREIAHLCAGVAGLDSDLLGTAVDRHDELGERFFRSGGNARRDGRFGCAGRADLRATQELLYALGLGNPSQRPVPGELAFVRHQAPSPVESIQKRSTWTGTTYGLESVFTRRKPLSCARRMLPSKSAKS